MNDWTMTDEQAEKWKAKILAQIMAGNFEPMDDFICNMESDEATLIDEERKVDNDVQRSF